MLGPAKHLMLVFKLVFDQPEGAGANVDDHGDDEENTEDPCCEGWRAEFRLDPIED